MCLKSRAVLCFIVFKFWEEYLNKGLDNGFLDPDAARQPENYCHQQIKPGHQSKAQSIRAQQVAQKKGGDKGKKHKYEKEQVQNAQFYGKSGSKAREFFNQVQF